MLIRIETRPEAITIILDRGEPTSILWESNIGSMHNVPKVIGGLEGAITQHLFSKG